MDDNNGCPAHREAGLVEETEHTDEITLKPGHRTNNVLKDGIKSYDLIHYPGTHREYSL